MKGSTRIVHFIGSLDTFEDETENFKLTRNRKFISFLVGLWEKNNKTTTKTSRRNVFARDFLRKCLSDSQIRVMDPVFLAHTPKPGESGFVSITKLRRLLTLPKLSFFPSSEHTSSPYLTQSPLSSFLYQSQTVARQWPCCLMRDSVVSLLRSAL